MAPAEAARPTATATSPSTSHGPDQDLRRPRGGARPVDAGQARHDLRLPRPQRLGQDHHHPHAVRPADARQRRRAPASATTSAPRADKIKRQRRLHDAALQPLPGPLGAREPGIRRAASTACADPRGAARDDDRAARPRRAARSSSPANCPAAGSSAWRSAPARCPSPQLLLLDEPTAGVDPKARREFWNEIHALAADGLTVLVSTHYMDEAERCHEIAYIAYGELLAHGTVDEVIAQSAARDLHRDRRPTCNALAAELARQARRRHGGAVRHQPARVRPRRRPRWRPPSRPIASDPALQLAARPSRRSRTCSST